MNNLLSGAQAARKKRAFTDPAGRTCGKNPSQHPVRVRFLPDRTRTGL